MRTNNKKAKWEIEEGRFVVGDMVYFHCGDQLSRGRIVAIDDTRHNEGKLEKLYTIEKDFGWPRQALKWHHELWYNEGGFLISAEELDTSSNKPGKLSPYTIAKNVNDVTDLKAGIQEIYDAIDKRRKAGKNIPYYYGVRLTKLRSKLEEAEIPQS